MTSEAERRAIFNEMRLIDDQLEETMTEETRYVSWYICNCEWTSKYCDENHRAGANVPLSVLESYESLRGDV